MKKIIIGLVVLTTLSCGILFAYIYKESDPYNGTVDSYSDFIDLESILTEEEAKDDLEYLYDIVSKKHISTISTIPNKFEEGYKTEFESINSDISVLELWEKSSRIIKELDDAHSGVYYYGEDEVISGEFSFENNSIYYKEKPENDESLKVISIAGIESKVLYDQFKKQFSYENIYWARNRFPSHLTKKSSLKWLGVSSGNTLKIKLLDENGDEKIITEIFEKNVKNKNHANADYKFVDYKILEEHNLGVFSLYECNYNDLYIETVKEFFDEVRIKKIDNIAIDLRFNGGGNSTVVSEFIRYLSVEEYKSFGSKVRLASKVKYHEPSVVKNDPVNDPFDGEVYVLTSGGTFSSATMFTTILRDNNLAKVIGEPSGNKPSAYGDVLTFQMPNSTLVLRTTYKEFIRPAVEKTDEEALIPDYEVDYREVYNKLFELVSK